MARGRTKVRSRRQRGDANAEDAQNGKGKSPYCPTGNRAKKSPYCPTGNRAKITKKKRNPNVAPSKLSPRRGLFAVVLPVGALKSHVEVVFVAGPMAQEGARRIRVARDGEEIFALLGRQFGRSVLVE